MVAINMTAKAIQDLSHRGFNAVVKILHLINNDSAAHYKTVQIHLASTKSSSENSVILIPKIQANTPPKSMQCKDWVSSVITKLDFKNWAANPKDEKKGIDSGWTEYKNKCVQEEGYRIQQQQKQEEGRPLPDLEILMREVV